MIINKESSELLSSHSHHWDGDREACSDVAEQDAKDWYQWNISVYTSRDQHLLPVDQHSGRQRREEYHTWIFLTGVSWCEQDQDQLTDKDCCVVALP